MVDLLSPPRRIRAAWAAFATVGALGLAGTACDSEALSSGGPTTGGDAGSTLCTPPRTAGIVDCTVGYDHNPCEVGTLDLPIDTLELPVPANGNVTDGLNLDGQSTSSASDPAGCFVMDSKASPTATLASVDNAMASVATALVPLGLDLAQAFASAVDRSTTASPPVDLSFRLGNWRGTASDECVTVYEAEQRTGLRTATLMALSGGTTPPFSPGRAVPLSLHLVRNGCTPDATAGITCEAEIAISLEAPRLRLHVEPAGDTWTLVTNRPRNPSAATVTYPSMLAGAVRFWDQDGLASPRRCDDGLANEAGTLAYELERAAPALGLDAAGAIALCEAFASRLDARTGPETTGGRSLEACGTTTTSRPNALSVGLYLGSGYVAATTFRP